MRKHSFILSLPVAAMTASMAFTQCILPVGTGLNVTDDSITSITTSFPIIFPGGSTTTAIDVDSNGRIFPSGSGDMPDFSASTSEFFGDAHPTIAPFWSDMDPATFGDVEFEDTGTQVRLFWNNTEFWLSGVPFDFWCELNPDGSFGVVFNQIPDDIPAFAIIGASSGDGAANPGPSDLTSAPDSGAVPEIYASFPVGPIALERRRYDFTPNGSGGYSVAESFCLFARARLNGPSCDHGAAEGPGTAISWTPNGSGGYDVATSAATFDSVDLGASIAAGDDTITTVNLGGASFTMPSGSVVTDVDIDSNGRINEVGAAGSDFSPTVAELMAIASIAPFNADMSPDVAGDVLFFTDGLKANFTWLDVPEFDEDNSLTFQVQMDLTGSNSWTVVYERVGNYTVGSSDNLVIGCSTGTGATPTESDLSTLPISTTVADVFEFFDPALTETQDLQIPGAPATSKFDFLSLPVAGTTFNMEITDISPTASSIVILLGVTPLEVPLNVVFPSMPSNCVIDHSVDLGDSGPIPGFVPGAATSPYDLVLPPGTSTIGFPVRLQAVIVDFNVPWVTEVAISMTNGIVTVFGI